jgi:Type IV pilus assembly protein PilM
MIRSSIASLARLQPPVRRIAALDAGSRRIKLLLAQNEFGRLRLLQQELFDLAAEGLVSADEIRANLSTILDGWGNPPLALVLPQHLTISQLLDLPSTQDEAEAEKLIADETVKLGGVSESRIVFDFVRTHATAANRQQFWVTLCQEGDIRDRISRLGLEHEDLCEVTTTANALLAAYNATQPQSQRAILVHVGAQTTVVVVQLGGQGAFATSFQMGGDFFTRSLARLRQIPEEAAETLKRTEDLLNGAGAIPEFAAVVDGWAAELNRQIQEWQQTNPEAGGKLDSFWWIGSGGGLEQPGLRQYLKTQAGLALREWPANTGAAFAPGKGFEVAFGAALQGLGQTPQTVSLLPEDYRTACRKRQMRQRIEIASLGVVVLLVLALAFGTWHKLSLINRKEALLRKVQNAQETLDKDELVTEDLLARYENLRPILADQQNTAGTLNTLALLEQSRSNRNFWYVLLADQATYFSLPQNPGTNYLNRTNLTSIFELPRSAPVRGSMSTNVSPAKAGLIAEVCIPGEAESARNLLRELVADMKPHRIYSKVDLVSEDLRRHLADAKVTLPDREYVLALDFADTQFEQPAGARKPNVTHRSRRGRTTPSEPAETSTGVAP